MTINDYGQPGQLASPPKSLIAAIFLSGIIAPLVQVALNIDLSVWWLRDDRIGILRRHYPGGSGETQRINVLLPTFDPQIYRDIDFVGGRIQDRKPLRVRE
jgi:hypothetical protein